MNDNTTDSTPAESFRRLLDIIATLRSPDGCPWDREQTPSSLRSNLLEETYECIDAIDSSDEPHIQEELGDVYLLVTMLAYMKQEAGSFSVSDVLQGISDKLVRRHPHVFGDTVTGSSEEVLRQWEEIKVKVEGREKKESAIDSVSRTLPPLERAFLLQKKAAGSGFDWKKHEDVLEKIQEELNELKEALQANHSELDTEMEMGDLLFSVINISRFLNIDPALALHKTNEKFARRFRSVEAGMRQEGLPMDGQHFEEMDRFWEEAKKGE